MKFVVGASQARRIADDKIRLAYVHSLDMNLINIRLPGSSTAIGGVKLNGKDINTLNVGDEVYVMYVNGRPILV